MGAFVVPAAEAGLTPVQSLDASRPLADATLDHVFVPHDRALGEPGSAASTLGIARALQEATVGLALETVGTCDALFQLLLAYVKERQQFGVAIGSFQAIKHKMSNMFLAIERARSLCYFAVAAINEDTPTGPTAVSMAKAASDDCQSLVGRESIQSFGGIGFTWEHDRHLFVKRAATDGALFGGAAAHSLAVAASPRRRLRLRHGRWRGAPRGIADRRARPGAASRGRLVPPHLGGRRRGRRHGPPAAPSTTSSWRARSRRRIASTPPSCGTSTTATRSSCAASGPTGGATCRSSGPTWRPGSRPRSWSTPASGSRPARSGATPWSGRR